VLNVNDIMANVLDFGGDNVHDNVITQDPYGEGWLLRFEVYEKPKDFLTTKKFVEFLKTFN